MICVENLTEKDKDREVTYTDGTGDKEFGHITSWNDTYIFVDYGNSCRRGIATSPEDLCFTFEDKKS